MWSVRFLALLVVASLATIWFILRLENVPTYVNFFHPFQPTSPKAFDARLYPEEHAGRDPKTIELDWVVRRELRAPDGVKKHIYTVNRLFPGPTIEARSGDRIILRLQNEVEGETTAIHFHGIRLLGSNSMDGTPGLTQCAIQPNNSFLYNFTIENSQSGTYWWHSHSLSQRADGLFGAFVIHKPVPQGLVSKPIDLDHSKDDLRKHRRSSEKWEEITSPDAGFFSERIVLVGDWYHITSSAMLEWYQSLKSYGYEPTPDTALFNGMNTFNCSRANRFVDCDQSYVQEPILSIDPDSRTRLRLVNTGSLAELEVSLDYHTLLVIEADGSPVHPRRVNSISIAAGQRYSVILEPYPSMTPRSGDYFWLRVNLSEECFNMYNPALDAEKYFLVVYGSRGRNTEPPGDPTRDAGLEEFNALSLAPLHPSVLPPADEQMTIYVNSVKKAQFGGVPYGFINRTSWKPDQHEPLILKETEGNPVTDWGKDQFVVTTHREARKVIELVINNMGDGPHPFHLHGHHFYPLHVHKSTFGWGLYNYSAPPTVPDEAPVLRDTFVVPRRGHVVIRFLADAPGMWLFHCHVMVHLSTG